MGRGNLKHGRSYASEYKVWQMMKQRCENIAHTSYDEYGGRGIKVCKQWQTFENFLADMGDRPLGLTIDRINNDGNYEPNNCRWATKREQALNARSNLIVTAFGKTAPLAAFFENSKSIEYRRARQRIQRDGWSAETAIGASP